VSSSSYQWFQRLGSALVALLGVGAIAAMQVPQLSDLKRRSLTPSLDELQQQTTTQLIQLNLLKKFPTLGFDNLVADWVFLNFLQYFGDEPARQKTDYRLSPDFFDVIIPRNPRFLQTYSFLSTSTSLYAALPQRSIALTELGLKSLTPTIPPGSFFVWRSKAIDELLFLGDAKASQQSFETAGKWAEQSPLPGSKEIAQYSQLTAQFLARNPDSRTAQVAAWAMVLNNAPDKRTQNTAINRIQSLGGQVKTKDDGTLQVLPPAKD